MRKVIDKVGVRVTDQTSDSKTRQIEIEIQAEGSLFTISDLLVKEEALESLQTLLRRNTKQVVSDYIQSGKQMLKTVATAAVLAKAEEQKASQSESLQKY